MNLVARRKSEQNKAVLDPWTVVHLAVGLAAGLMSFRFAPAGSSLTSLAVLIAIASPGETLRMPTKPAREVLAAASRILGQHAGAFRCMPHADLVLGRGKEQRHCLATGDG